MAKRTLAFVLLIAGTAQAAPPARTMYADALGREQDVRAAMTAADVTPAVLTDVRAVVDGYDAVVKHYPASGYSDNALWQAGLLSLEVVRVPVRPVRVRVPGLLFVLSVRIRRAPKGSRQIARGIKCQSHGISSPKDCHRHGCFVAEP